MSGWIGTPFDGLPGFSRFFVDHAAGRLPASTQTLRLPEAPEAWERVRAARPPHAPEAGLLEAMAREQRRLNAPAATFESLRRLGAGDTHVVITGQQPGLGGGPLFNRYKIATAVALARWLTGTRGISAVPVFWNAADDADFDEAAHARLARADLSLAVIGLDANFRKPRAWVGDVPIEAAVAAETLSEEFGPAPSAEGLRDFGDWMSRAALDAFGADGLIVLDARLPEIRRAAAPLFRRYLDGAAEVAALVTGAGEALEREGYKALLTPEAAAACLFVTTDRARERLEPAEALARAAELVGDRPESLSPNVVLRPLVADSVLPTIASVLGPGELSYFSQIAAIYPRLGVEAPVTIDRLSATLLPPELFDVARGLDLLPRDLLGDPAEALRRWLERQLPPELTLALDEARRGVTKALDQLREPARSFDPSLIQMIDSALEKSLFQQERLAEGVFKKIKQKRELQRPRLKHLSDFLLPRQKPQERELASRNWTRLAPETDLNALALAHVEALMSGRRVHYLVTL